MTAFLKRGVTFVADAYVTCLGAGYIRPRGVPFGGTTATAMGVGAVYLLGIFTDFTTASLWYFVAAAVILITGIGATYLALKPDEDDPKRIVLDEFIGAWATLAFVPLNPFTVIAAFVLFRILDITKPLGVRYLERLPKGFGVMLDDVGAGVLGAAILNLGVFLFDLILNL